MRKYICIIIFILVSSFGAYADDAANKKSGDKFQCQEDTAAICKHFPKIQKAARKINQSICRIISESKNDSFDEITMIEEDIDQFVLLVKQRVMEKFSNVELDKLQFQLDCFEEKLKQDIYTRFVNDAGTIVKRGQYYFNGCQEEQGFLTARDDGDCKNDPSLNAPCSDILEQLETAIAPYQLNINALSAHKTQVQLKSMAKDWDAYFERGRAQTFADIVVTTFFESRHLRQDHLVGPPKRQWFILHPNLVIENVDAAPDGDNLKPALSIEWIGVNWWNKSPIGIPLGVSATSLYSDRPGVDDVGHGISLHIDNKFVLGWANHGGDNGFYISMDLLRLVDDKKKKVKRYREKVDGFNHLLEELEK